MRVAERLRAAWASVDQRILPCKTYCFWLSASSACYYAFLPVVYANMGVSPGAIGVLTGVAPLVSALSNGVATVRPLASRRAVS